MVCAISAVKNPLGLGHTGAFIQPEYRLFTMHTSTTAKVSQTLFAAFIRQERTVEAQISDIINQRNPTDKKGMETIPYRPELQNSAFI